MTNQPKTTPETTEPSRSSRIVIEFDGMQVNVRLNGEVTVAQMFAASGILAGEANYMMDAHRAQRMASAIEIARVPPRKQ